MATNINVRNIYSTVEKMHSCESSVEVIIVILKELMAPTFFGNKYTDVERITQTMDDCKIFCEINIDEWIKN